MLWNFLFVPILLSLLLIPHGTQLLSNHFPAGESKVLLVTAHPDDECMFFGPTVLALRERNVDVFGLVFSNGNADGLGKRREGELMGSFEVLGVARDRVWVLDHPQLQDNITQTWPADLISGIIYDHVMRLGVTDIITFDIHGVSKHPNHISVCEGALRFKATFTAPPKQPTLTPSLHHRPRLWTLESVRLARKYSGVFNALSTKLVLAVGGSLQKVLQAMSFDVPKPKVTRVTIVATPSQYVASVAAMRKHATQLVWFRYLYVSFSKYMWVNDLVEMQVTEPITSSAQW